MKPTMFDEIQRRAMEQKLREMGIGHREDEVEETEEVDENAE